MSLGLSPSGGGGGSSLSCSPTGIPANATGVVTQLSSGLSGTLTYSKVTGSAAALSVTTGGAVSISSGLAAAATATLIARVQNATGDAIEKSFTLTGTVIAISGTPSAAIVGSAYSFTPTTTGGSGTKTFSYTGTTLASYGLAFSTTTGAITGTVSGSAGTIAGTIGVSDTTGTASPSLAISIAVAGGALSISGSPGSPAVGDTTVFTPTITGGSGSYTSIAVVAGTLPAGRSISGLTVTGTYTTAGAFSYTLRVTDSLGATADLAVSGSVSAVATISVPAPYYGLVDDFETSTALTARPNWTFPEWDNIANSASDPVWWRTDTVAGVGGFLHMSTTFKGNGVYFAAAANLGSDIVVDIGYDTTGIKADGSFRTWAVSVQSYRIWAIDANNYVDLAISETSHRLEIGGKFGGTNFTTIYYKLAYGQPLPTWVNKRGEIHVEVKGGQLAVRLDGVWLYPALSNLYPPQRADYSAFTKSGPVALKANTYEYAMLQFIRAKSLDISIDFIDEFVGRDSLTATRGTARLEMTYAGTATPVQWVGRVLDDANRSTVVQDWAALENVSFSAGSCTAKIGLPTGGPYTVEAGFIGSDGLLHTTTSLPTISGILILEYGQSNCNYRGLTLLPSTYQKPLRGAAYCLSESSGFNSIVPKSLHSSAGGSVKTNTREVTAGFNSYQGVATLETAKILSGILNKPIGIRTFGRDGSGIGGFIGTVSDPVTDDFKSALAFSPGIVEAVCWEQGEGDCDISSATSGSAYVSNFATMTAFVRSVTGNPNLPFIISMPGRWANQPGPDGNAADATNIDQNREILRQAYLTICQNDPLVHIGSNKLGIDHGTDATHYPSDGTGRSYIEMCRRDAYSFARWCFGQTGVFDGTGPQATAATRSGAVITLAMNLNGAASITGPITYSTGSVTTLVKANSYRGYQVSADNFSTLLAVSSITTDGTNLVITLAADPGGPVKIRSMYGWSYDDTILWYGTGWADGRANLPVAPIVTPLVSN